MFAFKRGGLEAKIDEASVWNAVSSLEGKFTSDAVLKKIYEDQGIPKEYWEKYAGRADRDAVEVNKILESFVNEGSLRKWDVYYEKLSNISEYSNGYACAAP